MKNNNQNYLPVSLGLLALTGFMYSACNKDGEEITIPPVFINAQDLSDHIPGHIALPSIYRCVAENADQISPIELTIEKDAPDIPDALPVYRVIRPDVTEDYAISIADMLDLNDNIEILNSDFPHSGFNFRKDGKALDVHKDGSIAVYYVADTTRPSSLPSDDECIDIAKNWLEENNLYPQNVISISIIPINVYVSRGYDIIDHFTSNINVIFSIGLEGYEVQGMGAYVAIGEAGKILTVFINTPEFKKSETVSLRQPETLVQTFADYLDNLELFYTEAPLCLVDRIDYHMSVTDIKLKYFCMLSNDSNITALAQPVLILEGTHYNYDPTNSGVFSAKIDAVIRE